MSGMLCAAGIRSLEERRSYPAALAHCLFAAPFGSPELHVASLRYVSLSSAQRVEVQAELERCRQRERDMRAAHGRNAEADVVDLHNRA